MKAYLMYRSQDFDPEQSLPSNEGDLTQDLELDTLFAAMAHGDRFLYDVAKSAVLSSLHDPAAILYRQQVLADCIEHPQLIIQIYNIAVEAIEVERKIWGLWGDSPESLLHRSVELLQLLVPSLKKLRDLAVTSQSKCASEGLTRFFQMLFAELDDTYFQLLEQRLRELKFRHGVLMSAELGRGNKGTNYILRRPREQRWIERLASRGHASYSFYIAERDEAGFTALTRLREQGLNLVANAAMQATDHIRSFFRLVRAELAFYIGCVNLRTRLLEKGEPTCFPVPTAPQQLTLSAKGLYDVSLALKLSTRAVGNSFDADGKSLVVITGANQGGKSTFLRSVGIAHLMMQSGMFVPAESLTAAVCSGIFTHFKREEDPSMKSGKLDEELSRMSGIANTISSHGLLLCNESFASTNEREGSELARQVIRALIECGVKVCYVTHLYDLADGLYRKGESTTLFLRAERQEDGRRTYRLAPGEPLPTSYGEDTYQRIFGRASHPALPEVGQQLKARDERAPAHSGALDTPS